MIYDRFVQGLNTIPLISPQDTAATALTSPYTALGKSHGGTAFIQFGVVTGVSDDQPVTITVLAATTQAGTSAAAVAFNYRLSSAVGDNAWGAITAAAAAGVAPTSVSVDGKMLAIEINPADILRQKADATHFALVITPDTALTVTNVSAFVQLEPRYSQSTHVSAT